MSDKNKRQIGISELLDNAVNDAVARRIQAFETEEALTDLSKEEVEAIRGGLKYPIEITAGIIYVPEETM